MKTHNINCMWIEQQPKIGDTIKFEHSQWYKEETGLTTTIGVVTKSLGDYIFIDIGDRFIVLSNTSAISVYHK